MAELIILGMGPSAWQCPWDTEVWGLQMGWEHAHKDGHELDKLFLTHTQVYSDLGNPFFNWEEISKQSFEVISTHKIKGLKASPFPMERICHKFQTEYFSNTICYMIAYALDMCTTADLKLKEDAPYSKFRFYGVDILTQDEMDKEKGGIEFWIGLAKGLGIPCEITHSSTLLKKDRPQLPVTLLSKGSVKGENEITGMIEIVGDMSKIKAIDLIHALGG